MKNLKDLDVKNKTILMRCDFNVPVEDGKVVDDYRITQVMPTIKDLIDRGAKVVLMSHMGRPNSQKRLKKSFFGRIKNLLFKKEDRFSLKPVHKELEKHLDKVGFVDDCISEKAKKNIKALNSGEVLLLENLRYYIDEEEGEAEFAKRLTQFADIYVNDAFSASHRDHASVFEVAKRMDSYPGYLFEREVKFLTRVKENPDKPLVVIVGGAKVKSKAKTIKEFMDKADHVLVGGKVANAILAIKGITDKEPPAPDVVEELEEIDLTSSKLHLPVDVRVSSDFDEYVRSAGVGQVRSEENIFDIGPETIDVYGEIIREASTIVWAGPLGFFEHKKFEDGTKLVGGKVIENGSALKIIGGGDTGSALNKFNLREGMDHVSLGGGAMLTFVSGKEMPGLEVLKKEK